MGAHAASGRGWLSDVLSQSSLPPPNISAGEKINDKLFIISRAGQTISFATFVQLKMAFLFSWDIFKFFRVLFFFF